MERDIWGEMSLFRDLQVNKNYPFLSARWLWYKDYARRGHGIRECAKGERVMGMCKNMYAKGSLPGSMQRALN